MLFTFSLIDTPGAAEMRQCLRPERAVDPIAFAAPHTHDDGFAMLGSAGHRV